MCTCRRCRHLLSLGLAVGIVALHDPPHAHVPSAGEQDGALKSVVIVSSSSSNRGVTGSAALTVGIAISARGVVMAGPCEAKG